jgi:hypothetical protein
MSPTQSYRLGLCIKKTKQTKILRWAPLQIINSPQALSKSLHTHTRVC